MVDHESSTEIWRDVPDYEYPYEVSALGRVRRSEAENNTYVGKILQPRSDKNGYPYVVLSSGGAVKTFKVHVLVCRAFHGEAPDIPTVQVRHINGIPHDNRVENLCWGTAQDNAADRKRHGRQAHGETAHQALLTQGQVDTLRRRYAGMMKRRRAYGYQRIKRGTLQKWAQELGVSKHCIVSVLGGKGYNNV